eukprot:11308868-Karenia_brevis.AAC.1
MMLQEFVNKWEEQKTPWQVMEEEVPHCRLSKMFAQTEKRLEIVVPKLIQLDFEKLLETDISMRSPTW